ncbi:MAG: GntR family transcriptional regulator, partial [bacterium]|nr:GntR family transcriptional regulator [bacterium]
MISRNWSYINNQFKYFWRYQMNNYTFPISKSNKMYIDIYEHIKDDILKGELSKDEKLPSKRVLAKHLNVSLNTII